MRSIQRDAVGMTTFGALVVDAASGYGLAQPGGIPYTWVRASTGLYHIRYNPAARAITGKVTPSAYLIGLVQDLNTVPGQTSFSLLNAAFTVTNGHFIWEVTAIGPVK